MELAKKLGYQILKPHQEEAIVEFVSGKDMLMTLPTGYGKSLCYQSLPLVYDEGRTILVAICNIGINIVIIITIINVMGVVLFVIGNYLVSHSITNTFLSLDDFVNPQQKHFYVIHSTMILRCYVGRYVMCQYGFVHNSCTCSSPDLLHTCSPHPSREGLAPRLEFNIIVAKIEFLLWFYELFILKCENLHVLLVVSKNYFQASLTHFQTLSHIYFLTTSHSVIQLDSSVYACHT